MLSLIRSLPEQLEAGYHTSLPPVNLKGTTQFLWAGMGGSGLGGELLKSYLEELAMGVVHDYLFPHSLDPNVFVFIVSYSGNSEETLSCYEDAKSKRLNMVVLTSGGELRLRAERDGIPIIDLPQGLPPRAALGHFFALPIKLLVDNRIIPHPKLEELLPLSRFLKNLQKNLEKNDSIAMEFALKFYKRIPILYGSNRLYPVLLRWQTQLNENAKSFAHIGILPEINHNELAGIKNPKEEVEEFWPLFFKDPEDNERIKKRITYSRELLSPYVMGTSILEGIGDSFLARMFYLLYVGDYVSLFLAELYQEDPLTIQAIDQLKAYLNS